MSVMVKNKTNKNDKRSQRGRSMVEMLGVLAIIGVLSAGGVYGYGVAMKKHKANELLHRASMLASTVSAQIMTGKNPTELDSFANSNLGTFTLETYTDGDNTFKLKISDIDGNVCEQMKSSMGGMVRDIVCDENAKTALMTFNKDLSTTDLPKTESVIDKNITNPEDCQKAGKTWCVGLNEGQGACSNVKDCCQSVSVDNVCQSCFSATGEIINRVQASSCDSDGDGSNDGICFPVEQTDESCSGTSLDALCLNGVQFKPSDNMMCVPVSCKALESMNLSQCCYEYDLDILMQAGMDALESGNMPQVYSYIDQIHVAQCTTCDSDTANTTSLADGTECGYVDLGYSREELLPGICQNGKCIIPVRDCSGPISPCQICNSNNMIENKLVYDPCDGDNDGVEEGVCAFFELTNRICNDEDEDESNDCPSNEVCMYGRCLKPSRDMLCLPYEKSNLYCQEYDEYTLEEQEGLYLQNRDFSSLRKIFSTWNIGQCNSCDYETGNLEPYSNRKICSYKDLKENSAYSALGMCQNGTCIDVSSTKCRRNSDCQNVASCQNNLCYCNAYGSEENYGVKLEEGTVNEGICIPVNEDIGNDNIIIDNQRYIASNNEHPLDYFSAYNFCKANNMNLLSSSEVNEYLFRRLFAEYELHSTWITSSDPTRHYVYGFNSSGVGKDTQYPHWEASGAYCK